MYKTFFNIVVDPESKIGVTFFATEPDEPYGGTSAILRIYKDGEENALVEKRFYAVEQLTSWKLHFLPSEDFYTSFLGLRIIFSVDNHGTVFSVIDAPDYKATFRLKDVDGTTELPF